MGPGSTKSNRAASNQVLTRLSWSLWPPVQKLTWQEELAGTGRRRWFICFLLGNCVWLSGPMCFSDTWAASPAPLLVGYMLIFYHEDAGMVRDSLSIEVQLSIAAQTFGGLSSFFSCLSEKPFARIFFFFLFFFSEGWEMPQECTFSLSFPRPAVPVMY